MIQRRLYWASYGWMAPGEAVSGVEDEYNLAHDIPMLIYIKNSGQRDPRLDALLDRIRDDDRVSHGRVSMRKSSDRRLSQKTPGHLPGAFIVAPTGIDPVTSRFSVRVDAAESRRSGSIPQ